MRRHAVQLSLLGIVLAVAAIAVAASIMPLVPNSQNLLGNSAYNNPYLKGFLDVKEPGRVSGWAFEVANPAVPVTIEVYDGSTLLVTRRTSLDRQDVKSQFGIAGTHGFDIPLSLSPGPHVVTVRAKAGVWNVILGRYHTSVAQRQLKGHVDSFSHAAISGWVYDPSAPSAPVTVTIFIDEKPAATLVASQQRPAAAPGAAGNHQFSYRPALAPGEHRVRVVAQSGGATAVLKEGILAPTGSAAGAAFVSQDVPLRMRPGKKYNVSVTMRNTGETVWTAGQQYRLGAQRPQDNLQWGIGRVELGPDERIPPGAEKRFTFTVVAPQQPGTYEFQWQMLQEKVAWLGEKSPALAITVGEQQPAVAFRLIDAHSSDLNAVAMGGWPAMIASARGAVYACYVNASGAVVIAKSVDDGETWQRTAIHFGSADNAHNLCSIGIDPQGRIHAMYDMHSSTLNYKVSTAPHSITSFAVQRTTGAGENLFTYPSFFTTPQGEFYLLHRYWISGHGDLYLKRLQQASWTDVNIPFMRGTGLQPPDSAYWSNIAFDSAGNWHLAWVHRIGIYNVNLSYARYNAALARWETSDGQAYALPITRHTAETVVPATEQDGLTNTGLNMLVDGQGIPHIIFSKQAPDGYREVFHAAKRGKAWEAKQITDFNAPRLRGCIGDTSASGPPRPCDMELGGPTAVMDRKGRIFVFVGKAIGPPSRGAWARPPATLHWLMSADGGRTWTAPKEIALPSGHTNEIVYDAPLFHSTGKLRLFLQTVDSAAGPLYYADVDLELLAGS